jgi:hypothetical protein
MFLDEKLYQYVINHEFPNNATDFRQMVNELYRICEDHFKPRLFLGMSFKEGTLELDRVFNSWNLFIGRLKKRESSNHSIT